MGVVYEGLHTTINKRVAIKVIRAEQAADPVMARRVLAEAQAVSAVNHRGIVDVHAHGLTPDGRPYLVLEYLEGEALDSYLRREGTPLPPYRVAELLLEASAPLAAAHRAGVVHRDLKPSNFFMCSDDDGGEYLKLLDFGLAKRSAPGRNTSSTFTSASMIVGTPSYIAPEQARALPTDARTDIYSLGVMAFELFSGRLPYNAPTNVDLVMQHLSAPVPKLTEVMPGLPEGVSNLVASMMAKDPAARPSSVEVVRAELKRLLPTLPKTRLSGSLMATPLPVPAASVSSSPVVVAPDLAAAGDDGTGETYQRLPSLETEPLPAKTAVVARTREPDLTPREAQAAGSTGRLWWVLGGLVVLLGAGVVVVVATPAKDTPGVPGSGETGEPRTATEPVVAEPVVAEPVVAEPAVAEPAVAEPVVRPPEATPASDAGVAKQTTPRVVKKAPTRAELMARISKLEGLVEGSKLVLLKKYRDEAESASTDAERKELARALDEFERRLR